MYLQGWAGLGNLEAGNSVQVFCIALVARIQSLEPHCYLQGLHLQEAALGKSKILTLGTPMSDTAINWQLTPGLNAHLEDRNNAKGLTSNLSAKKECNSIE